MFPKKELNVRWPNIWQFWKLRAINVASEMRVGWDLKAQTIHLNSMQLIDNEHELQLGNIMMSTGYRNSTWSSTLREEHTQNQIQLFKYFKTVKIASPNLQSLLFCIFKHHNRHSKRNNVSTSSKLQVTVW